MKELHDRLRAEVAKVVVGQDDAVEALVVALALGGHALLEGVPGVAKTLLANTVARALGLDFGRVQFTPDMLPSDITGTVTLRGGELSFRPGPVFTNVLLADEINRTPPKTQSALLEAMQEGQVTVDGEGHALPEAQLDRFLVKVDMGYPDESEERALLGLARRGLQSATIATSSSDTGRRPSRARRSIHSSLSTGG